MAAATPYGPGACRAERPLTESTRGTCAPTWAHYIGEPRYPHPVRKPVENFCTGPVSRETSRRDGECPRIYPQAQQAHDMVFHVKLGRLWITPVDNFTPS
ncbi:hypothetical protein GCM10012284_29070 [Mangrovihabitans endophyticus]|uniref:Uncharacterized protein n=1 Tax=Mangrovihabitans endophyticus TaxID=1751298 RepID=A0A8J3BZE9_9ACTN|nr:hypothetical protein GCM10012284_29070 [Mangrovihabitans endophyticus]